MEIDPKQLLFLTNYLDPKSDTFSNCFKSGVKAGYSEEYSRNLLSLMPVWLSTSIDRVKLLDKAERNLNRALDIPIEDEKIGERALKASIFVAKGLGKDIYSERTELTGKEGKDLTINIVKYGDTNSV